MAWEAYHVQNGWVGQFSVQAIDFNILIISITVLITVRKNRLEFEPTWKKTLAVCAVPWIFPLITSKQDCRNHLAYGLNVRTGNIALILHGYGPVSGNWCWIKKNRQDLRWALTHGWRVAIFIATVSIYTYVYIYLARSYRKASSVSSHSSNRRLASTSEQELCRMDTGTEDQKNATSTKCTPTPTGHNPNERAKRTPELR